MIRISRYVCSIRSRLNRFLQLGKEEFTNIRLIMSESIASREVPLSLKGPYAWSLSSLLINKINAPRNNVD